MSAQCESRGADAALPELNIGQLVNGNVYVQQILFNVGGKPMTLQELPDDELRALQKLLRRAKRRREAFASMPFTLWGCVLLATTVALLQWAPIREPKDVLTAGVALAFTGVMVWAYMRTWFGTSPRVQRSVAAQLEDRLVLVNLELDVRTLGAKPRSFLLMFRDWMDSQDD